MKDNRCIVCRFKQIHSMKTKDDLIFDSKGNAVYLPLCYTHSLDLYKLGQISFIMKYNKIFSTSLNEETKDLIKYLPNKDRYSLY